MKISAKDIRIKNRTYYFLNDIINIKHFDPDNIEIDDKSYKNIFIYYIGYVKIKKGLKIYSANSLSLLLLRIMDTLKQLMIMNI